MNPLKQILPRAILGVSLGCLCLLMAGIIWASARSFEMTDEAYYLLSAIHPDAVQAYISAQHWTLAPLWKLTGTLMGFRLTGAAVLIGSASLLAAGAMQVSTLAVHGRLNTANRLSIIAASCIFAFLYVATIEPSPSYNLLAAAGAYAGAGATLLAIANKTLRYALLSCALAGIFLAIGFVNKPSAGVSSALLSMAWILVLQPGYRKWLCLLVLPATAAITVLGLALLQSSEPGVLQSLQNGLTLFRQVQTEPVGERLIRYAVTLLGSIGQTTVIFAPALVLVAAGVLFQRMWLGALALGAFLTIIVIEQSFLGGMSNYRIQLEAIYALMLALAITGLARTAPFQMRESLLFLGLAVLPYAVAVGTGNALFTQVIVSLAPWGVLAALAVFHLRQDDQITIQLLRQGIQILLLVLITSQILSSYTRDPYHLAAPLTGQNTLARIGSIGSVRTDPATAQMISEVEKIKENCSIPPGSPYLGLYNTPGLALLLDAVPPVSPWLNNAEQIAFVLELWRKEENTAPVILAITLRPDGTPYPLPDRLESARINSVLCGQITLPYNQDTVEIRTAAQY